ncbi:hypothetical protein SH668x_001686 [Planctomicrobium sp. SH668]|uniref:hypothetical protein n=1 Tax=Planctomicrobium sp. SH668 TaxID=3448126 RepID=UPI003F5BAF3D
MRSLLHTSLAAVAAIGMVVATATYAISCPFCSAPTLTLSEQLAAAQAAVLVQWSSGTEADRERGFTGTTEYEILQVVRGDESQLKKGGKIAIDRFRSGKPGDLSLLLGTQIEDRLEWSSPLEVTETSFNYIIQAPSKESPTTERLEYYLKFLEFPDQTIATDAYSEFANAPYDDITPLGDKMPRDKLREWLSNKDLNPTRMGLYGLLLGLGGHPEDAEFLKSIVIMQPEDFRLGIDGVMGGYLLLTGSEGLEVLNETKLRNTKAHFSETFAAMQALRFMWTYAKGRVPAEDLRSSMQLLLKRPNLADLVIVDLARWQDWGTMPHLMELYDNKDYQVPSVKRAIVRFMLIAEKDAPQDGNLPVPEYVTAARKNLEILREKDPKTVKAAERYFFD